MAGGGGGRGSSKSSGSSGSSKSSSKTKEGNLIDFVNKKFGGTPAPKKVFKSRTPKGIGSSNKIFKTLGG